MIWLTGSVKQAMVPALLEQGIGLMVQPQTGYESHINLFSVWAADNGCYAAKGNFNIDRWWQWLNRLPRSGCLFACAPDVLLWDGDTCHGDAKATLELAYEWLPKIREAGFPAALVLQDGVERQPIPWLALDAVFVGGSDQFKLAQPTLNICQEACRRNKWTHLGRCNTKGRIITAAASDVIRSADGTKLRYGWDRNLPELQRWLAEVDQQPSLWKGQP